MKRNIYLSSLTLEDAQQQYFDKIEFESKVAVVIPVDQSLGRVASKPVFAKLSSPHYNASAMDGIMVIAKETYGVNERNPKRFNGDSFKYVDTGDVITEPYDAVIMIEDIQVIDDETIEIIEAASPWQHIRPIGEDIVQSEMIIPAGHKIRPVDIGALYSGGIFDIEVIKKPSVGILPTGTEIVEPKEELVPGEIIDSNSRMFEALTLELGGDAIRYQALPDDYELLKNKIDAMSKAHDIIVINAGSSSGSEDYTMLIIKELGEVVVHGVAIKPGKPAILGLINNKPVVGIPGYPVSAYFVYDLYVKPLIEKWYLQEHTTRPTVTATLSKRLMSSLKHREYIRMKLGFVKDKIIATPLNRGAGVTMSLVKADGICIVPQNIEGYEAGTEVAIELLKPVESIKNTLVSIGSHDILLDLVADMMENTSLSSTHVGSMGGIMAMMKDETHIAPIHLLNETDGIYNIEAVKKYLKNKDVTLVKGVRRTQGFYVQKGNPMKIKGIQDLLREDIIFVNRQKGAGTRILLDYLMKENNISKNDVHGYDREMMTHMTVASAVKSGTASMGMGIQSVARILDLDFIPVGEEHYDFIVQTDIIEKEIFKAFLKVLKSEMFSNKLAEIGGYNLTEVGDIIKIK